MLQQEEEGDETMSGRLSDSKTLLAHASRTSGWDKAPDFLLSPGSLAKFRFYPYGTRDHVQKSQIKFRFKSVSNQSEVSEGKDKDTTG